MKIASTLRSESNHHPQRESRLKQTEGLSPNLTVHYIHFCVFVLFRFCLQIEGTPAVSSSLFLSCCEAEIVPVKSISKKNKDNERSGLLKTGFTLLLYYSVTKQLKAI